MVLWDLEKLPLPFEASEFDEVHAYEVCEHVTGYQGQEAPFFAFWSEMHRILKPGGFFLGSVPADEWVWADPGHKREITVGTLTFLSRREYREQVGKTHMSDYRSIYTGDFELIYADKQPAQLRFVLQKVGE